MTARVHRSIMPFSPVAPTSSVSVTASKVSDWGTGYDGHFEIRNDNAYDVLNWTMTYDMHEDFTWFSDGDLTKTGDCVSMVPKSWNLTIPAGKTLTLGFGGQTEVPTNVKFHQILPLVGDDPSEKTRGAWTSKSVAPYVDACAWPTPSLAGFTSDSGLKYYTLAFIVADPENKPAWGGTIELDTQYMLDQIRNVRASGGDVSISFGGANGTELALAIENVDDLVDAYSQVIDLYTLNHIDFDIEGGAVADAPSIDRRNKALAKLNAKYPDLKISYCLPVLPTGLTADGIALVRNAHANGVHIDVWRCMSMDFGDSAAPSPNGKMGAYVIQSAEAVRVQVETEGYANPNVGLIPMIGVNDVDTEVFGLDDAKQVAKFFYDTPWMTYVGFWSVNRDRPGNTGACSSDSGISQNPYDFSKAFLNSSIVPPVVAPKPKHVRAKPTGTRLDPHPHPATPSPIPSVTHPSRVFSPYVESWLDSWNGKKLSEVPYVKNFTFAFCLSNRGKPSFDGTMPADRFLADAKAVRAKGGDVRISFGGATGTELATDVHDETKLFQAYKSVIDLYSCTYIDFDVEGAAISDVATNARRNRVIAKLQQAYPDLRVDFTLGVMQNGLPNECIALLRDATDRGVHVNSVNLMVMDYGTGSKSMGEDAIRAATNSKKQIDSKKLAVAGIGLTPMIGMNDTAPECFSLDDAKRLVDFANSTSWVNFVGFWSLGRDNPKDTKLSIKPFDFTKTFSSFS